MEEKYIGLCLALAGSLAIGTSFIVTKKGLNDAASKNTEYANASDNLAYLKNCTWWLGISLLIIGEIANFAAYAFAPPILVTPLGASSVIVGAVLASFFLNESLGHLGRVGCTLCIIGSVIIVLNAPPDKDIETVDEILHYAVQPGFLMYCFTVLVFALVMIYIVAPVHGRKTPVVYLSICSLVGSVSVMAIKGFGVAVKLTLGGSNQFTHPSTYVFGTVIIGCIVTQMNYFNKALETFSTNVVNPIYYVGFSTATLVASLILFQGINTTDGSKTASLMCGFAVTFLGVHLLNISRVPDNSHPHSALENGLMNPRLSVSGRMSVEGWNGFPYASDSTSFVPGHGQRNSLYRQQGTTLFNAFEDGADGGEAVGLHQLHEDPEEDDEDDDEREDVDERTHLRSLSNGRIDHFKRQGSTHSIHTSPTTPSRASPISRQNSRS